MFWTTTSRKAGSTIAPASTPEDQEAEFRSMKFKEAETAAKKLAKAGPRVAAILNGNDKPYWAAVPGYVDGNDCLPKGTTQEFLVTPDGRVWSPIADEELRRRGLK